MVRHEDLDATRGRDSPAGWRKRVCRKDKKKNQRFVGWVGRIGECARVRLDGGDSMNYGKRGENYRGAIRVNRSEAERE